MASKYGGYAGKVLTIDLTSETISEYPWTDAQRELCLGGKGMALQILCDLLTGTEQAFSEEAPVIIATGPLTGTSAPASIRFDIASLSPLSGLPVSSNCGGSFGLHLKKAGYDGLVLTGRCSSRRWLEINEDRISFHDAAPLWGSTSSACEEQLSQLMDCRHFGRLYIGPAGEHLVKYAAVMGDGRAAGRTGIGAVLGWKNLKAITVFGNKEIPIRHPEQAKKQNKRWHTHLHSHPLTGSGGEKKKAGSSGCMSCPIHCGKEGKEEKSSPISALLPPDHPKCSEDWSHLLNELGMDTIAAADALQWAVSAGKEGAFTFPIAIDNADTLRKLLEDIALRRGIGEALAEGEAWLSNHYDYQRPSSSRHGGHRRQSAYQVMMEHTGLLLSSHPLSRKVDCAVLFTDLVESISASGQCVFTVNGCCPAFMFGSTLPAKIIRWAASHAGWLLHNICRRPTRLFFPLPFLHHVAMLRYVTGMKLSPGRCLLFGRRCHTLERFLSCRFRAKRCKLPSELPKEQHRDAEPLYFAARGWDASGVPTEQTRKMLHIQ